MIVGLKEYFIIACLLSLERLFYGLVYNYPKKTFKYISVKNWHKKNNIILGKFSKPVIHNNYEK